MTDVSAIVSVLQTQNQILSRLITALQAGIAVDPTPASYTVATLPATGAAGQFAWASNGRKGAEGPGLGSGVPVFWNPATSSWFSYLSGVAVTS